MENQSKLKPCPFCGGEAIMADNGVYYWVECTKCENVFMKTTKSAEEAKKIWNRRVK